RYLAPRQVSTQFECAALAKTRPVSGLGIRPNTVDVIHAVSIGARDSASNYRQKPVSNLTYQQGCRHNGNHVSRPARSERMHCRDEGCLRDLYRLQVLTVWHSSAQVFPLTRPCGVLRNLKMRSL